MGLSAERIAQSEQRHLTLALGELPGMDCFGVNFHNCFKNVKLRCRILEYSFAQGLFFSLLILMGKLKNTTCYIISHRTLSHFTINEGEKGNGLLFFFNSKWVSTAAARYREKSLEWSHWGERINLGNMQYMWAQNLRFNSEKPTLHSQSVKCLQRNQWSLILPSGTTPLCFHSPGIEDLQCKTESDPILHQEWWGIGLAHSWVCFLKWCCVFRFLIVLFLSKIRQSYQPKKTQNPNMLERMLNQRLYMYIQYV